MNIVGAIGELVNIYYNVCVASEKIADCSTAINNHDSTIRSTRHAHSGATMNARV